ncbi:MAG: glycerol-3-phosphate 1-O-acyltransferase PlsY [Verrucomicrobia bacterium]|nr:glycerol-3-phosphate 1-O-acyltransferase PlsY [Kiritimatiellia bacterium]MCO6401279.1 glycerol-3-phosphate 1-O-acyltransferase PlsY [Verrucomicrobiota bacterium]
MSYAILGLVSYLLGAVPFGLLIGKMRGVDVRTVGSKNIGATNVLRTVGKPWGILTFLLDALKGFVPAFVFPTLGNRFGLNFQSLEIAALIGGAAAIVGHNFPVYLGFKGGKGVATSAGALLGIAPLAVGVGLVVWIVIFYTTRYVSLASIQAALAVPIVGWLYYRTAGVAVPIALTLLAALIIVRHRANIRRLLNGTENRFKKK